jgi:hypothetical protein
MKEIVNKIIKKIEQLVADNHNDQDLGAKVRAFFTKIKNK